MTKYYNCFNVPFQHKENPLIYNNNNNNKFILQARNEHFNTPFQHSTILYAI